MRDVINRDDRTSAEDFSCRAAISRDEFNVNVLKENSAGTDYKLRKDREEAKARKERTMEYEMSSIQGALQFMNRAAAQAEHK